MKKMRFKTFVVFYSKEFSFDIDDIVTPLSYISKAYEGEKCTNEVMGNISTSVIDVFSEFTNKNITAHSTHYAKKKVEIILKSND